MDISVAHTACCVATSSFTAARNPYRGGAPSGGDHAARRRDTRRLGRVRCRTHGHGRRHERIVAHTNLPSVVDRAPHAADNVSTMCRP